MYFLKIHVYSGIRKPVSLKGPFFSPEEKRALVAGPGMFVDNTGETMQVVELMSRLSLGNKKRREREKGRKKEAAMLEKTRQTCLFKFVKLEVPCLLVNNTATLFRPMILYARHMLWEEETCSYFYVTTACLECLDSFLL